MLKVVRVLLVVSGVVFWLPNLAAQRPPGWEPDRRLTFDPADSELSYNFARSIAADDDCGVHVVWHDTRGGGSQVYYKRSTDLGGNWSLDLRLSDRLVGSAHPAVAVAGSYVYVVWHGFRNGRWGVYFRQSRDGGFTWMAERLLSSSAVEGAHPAIAATGTRVHVVWGSGSDGQGEVYVRSSSNGGGTWGFAKRLSDVPFESWVATVAAEGPQVYVAWVDYSDANEEEYIRRSLDGGVTWGPAVRLTFDAADSWAASLAVSGAAVHMLWFDRREAGLSDADVERTLNRALALVGIPTEPPPPRDPAVYYLNPFTVRIQEKRRQIDAAAPGWVASGGDPRRLQALLMEFQYVFEQWAGGWELYYKRSRDGGRSWEPDVRLTFAPGVSARPSVAISGDALQVVWFDHRDDDFEIYYKLSPDGGTSWSPDIRLTRSIGDSLHPSVAVAGPSIHLVWFDRRDGNSEIYYKRGLMAQPPGPHE